MIRKIQDYSSLPGSEIVIAGLEDLRGARITESALLVLIAGPNLIRHGIAVAEPATVAPPYEHRLYDMLCQEQGLSAYSRYNSLTKRIVSFERALALLTRNKQI